MKTLFQALALSFLVAGSVQAATITEGIDYADGAVSVIGPIGPGQTTIQGNISGTCAAVLIPPNECPFGVDPVDAIFFGVAPGLKLLDVKIDLTAVTGPPDFRFELDYQLGLGPVISFSNLAPGVYDPGLPLPTAKTLFVQISGDNANGTGPYSADWKVNLIVSQVPLPAAAPMLLLGLGAMAVAARRRRRA